MNNKTAQRNELIWKTVRKVPPGCVATYGQIAHASGLIRGARQVGSALKQLPKNSTVPWHRIINSQGKLSFPKDSHSYKRQKNKLLKEGILFNNDKINLKQYAWREDLDALLWRLDD